MRAADGTTAGAGAEASARRPGRPLHVALVTHHYAPETCPPAARWRELSARFVAAGHRVTVLAPPAHYPAGRTGDGPRNRPWAREDGPAGETVHRVRYREHGVDVRSRLLDQLCAALDSVVLGRRRLHGPDRPDVVIATAPGGPSLLAALALAGPRRPVVVEMRDAWPDVLEVEALEDVARGLGRLLLRVAAALVRWAQRRAALVVTTTVAFADVLRDRGVARVAVVRNGVPVTPAPAPGPPRAAPGTDDGAGGVDGTPAAALHVLYLGTTGRSQGLCTAVRAVATLRDRGVAVRLRLVGSGFDDAALRAEVAATGAPVELVGRVPRAEVAAHYAWADTVLVALRDWPPFAWTVPSKLYEAMAVGRHVSAAVAGEAAAVVRDAGAGDVVPPEDADALVALWTALAADRARLDVGPGGRRWVAEHADLDRLAAHYLDLLAEVAP
ncbi:glycosyltransferase family 4 protein [Cellulomonas sp.]|uniref:glycosyltransferase family 4 protein n=1 Tax=Cellulomonas sp. TaxID=40001 RepID=UPI002D31A538|nr:glycosyltransferase family 4 protein [Cellulomonas sp.]HYQ76630.1 glycosyltransferase family 4 protein [Cellulomonas sp.]